MSPNSHGLSKKPVFICPSEVVEAEDPGHEELGESMPEPDVVPKGVAVPETPSDKDREAHELTHLPTQPWCSVCFQKCKNSYSCFGESRDTCNDARIRR